MPSGKVGSLSDEYLEKTACESMNLNRVYLREVRPGHSRCSASSMSMMGMPSFM